MTKNEITKIVCEESGVSHSDGLLIINLVLHEIKKEVLRGGKVSISNFGVFSKNYKSMFKTSRKLRIITNQGENYFFGDL